MFENLEVRSHPPAQSGNPGEHGTKTGVSGAAREAAAGGGGAVGAEGGRAAAAESGAAGETCHVALQKSVWRSGRTWFTTYEAEHKRRVKGG